ncbi:MAG: hypothetical protein L0211_15210, partial [Planctomycetaceae bacterium]|nr:hypothetical protein [Planctomycetaceae bacterium]
RCQTAESAAEEQRHEVQRLKTEVQSFQQQLAAASASPHQSLTLVGPVPSPAEDEELAQLKSQHEEQASALAQERRALDKDRASLEAASKELAVQRDDFLRTQRELEVQWRAKDYDLRSKEELLGSQAEELASRLEQAARQQAELESQRRQLSSLDRSLVKPASSLPTSDVPSIGAAQSEPAPSGEPAQPAAASEPNPEAPPAAIRESSLLRRSGSRPKPVWTQPDSPPPADESIETYMSRLLQRVSEFVPVVGDVVRKTQPPASASPSEAEVGGRHSEAEGQEPVTGDQKSDVEEQRPEVEVRKSEVGGQEPLSSLPVALATASPSDADSKVRESSSQSPETPTIMEAMREVANSVARSAIVRHQRDLGNRLAVAQAIGAGMTLVATMAAGWCAYRAQSFFGGVGATIGFVAACFWCGKALGHALKAMLLELPNADANDVADPAAEAETGSSEPAGAADGGQPSDRSLPDAAVEDNADDSDDAIDLPSAARTEGASADLVTTQSS